MPLVALEPPVNPVHSDKSVSRDHLDQREVLVLLEQLGLADTAEQLVHQDQLVELVK